MILDAMISHGAWIRKGIAWIPLAAILALPLSAVADVVVIVNPANSVPLDEEAIERIFLGQTRSFPGDGEALPVEQREGTAAREEFNARYLKRTHSQLKAYWSRQIFTGGAVPPRQLDDDDAVIKFVAATPGAIGYVNAAKVGNSVKVVRRKAE